MIKPLSATERDTLLTLCECGHTINDHGTLVPCWQCEEDNRECDHTFEELLVERVGVIVDGRVAH